MSNDEIPDYPELHKRDASIADAHTALSEAIRHLDTATTHGDELDRLWIAGIMRQLCEARQPLAEHIDLHDDQEPTPKKPGFWAQLRACATFSPLSGYPDF